MTIVNQYWAGKESWRACSSGNMIHLEELIGDDWQTFAIISDHDFAIIYRKTKCFITKTKLKKLIGDNKNGQI